MNHDDYTAGFAAALAAVRQAGLAEAQTFHKTALVNWCNRIRAGWSGSGIPPQFRPGWSALKEAGGQS